MFRFIHCADIHLDSPLYGLRFTDERVIQTIRNATRRALDNLVDLAIREQVQFVLIAGDVFDGDWEDYSTGLFFNRCMQRLASADIPVFLIRGNHDAASVITRHLTLPDNVTRLSDSHPETVYLETCAVAIHGQSFATRDVTDNLVTGYPKARSGYFNIGLLHTGLAGREGHARYAPCQLEDLEALGYDYWALGHIHQPEIVSLHPPVVYPGNIQGRHIRETGARGCVLVDVDGVDVQISRVNLDVLRWFEVACDMAMVETQTDAIARVRDAVGAIAAEHVGVPLCMRIRLTGVRPSHTFIHLDEVNFSSELANAAAFVAAQDVYVERVVIERGVTTDSPLRGGDMSIPDALVDVISSVARDGETIQAVQATLSEWQRAIATKMRADVAPIPVEEEATREAIATAMLGILAKLTTTDGGGLG